MDGAEQESTITAIVAYSNAMECTCICDCGDCGCTDCGADAAEDNDSAVEAAADAESVAALGGASSGGCSGCGKCLNRSLLIAAAALADIGLLVTVRGRRGEPWVNAWAHVKQAKK
jgi:hypothetical protein